MPKAKKEKFYAVHIGRNGPQVYNSWEECKEKVSRYPGAVHKSFNSRSEAEEWLATRPISGPLIPEPLPPNIKPLLPAPKVPEGEPTVDGPISLSKEQAAVYEAVKGGESVFFTGSAGTGKSVLLREIIEYCGGRHSGTVAITATTGIAALNIGGCTLHSWAGIGLGKETPKSFVGKCFAHLRTFGGKIINRWQQVNTLIIDEVSMLDGQLFDSLEEIARRMRNSDAPFGGIQLVICGDFCQLPPVPGKDHAGNPLPAKFAFEAKSWSSCVGKPMILTKVFRQKDQRFADMLNEMRFGVMSSETIAAFTKLSRPIHYTDGIDPCALYPTRGEVTSHNNAELAKLPGGLETYVAHDTCGKDSNGKPTTEARREQILSNLVCEKFLKLKVGAQVMLVKNLVQGKFVNGSVGKVVRFSTAADEEAKFRAMMYQDGALPPQRSSDKAAPEKPGPDLAPSRAYPVVRFTNGEERLIAPAEFSHTNADGEMEAMRVQVPLILAWGITIHKSQGQTLERVKVDLNKSFEKGQAYVAISRATSIERLQVLGFSPKRVEVHEKVLAWYDQQGIGNPATHRDYDSEDDY